MSKLLKLFLVFVFTTLAAFFLFSLSRKETQVPGDLDKLFLDTKGSSEFILMGDTGTGREAQYSVADSIKNYCATKNCKAVFILGDVIYEEGVKSLNDPQFSSKFEKPYANISLPFYILFGNHDYLGCTTCYLDYNDVSSKWKMPDEFYKIEFEDVTFYAVNTEKLNDEQIKWLSKELENDSSGWRVVLGHRPIISFEETKENENWQGKSELKAEICNSSDFYITGHAHVLEDVGNIGNCRVTQLISGTGGSYPRKVKKPYEGKFFFEDNGFLVLSVKGNLIEYEFFNEEGKSLYQLTSKKR